VQTIIPLSYNTSLKITTARYYTPSGRSIQKIDYSSRNKVFEKYSALDHKEFKTDNKRTVLSAGGIMPDSIVRNESNSHLIQNLLADGMFFKFATHFYNNNPKAELSKISSDLLLKAFTDYMKEEKFNFVSNSERLIDELKKASAEENLDSKFQDMLEKEKSQIDATHSNEIDKYRNDFVFLIREELAARIDGRNGRIRESLGFDKQFLTANYIISHPGLYSKFLR